MRAQARSDLLYEAYRTMGGRFLRQEQPISAVNRNLAVFFFPGNEAEDIMAGNR